MVVGVELSLGFEPSINYYQTDSIIAFEAVCCVVVGTLFPSLGLERRMKTPLFWSAEQRRGVHLNISKNMS